MKIIGIKIIFESAYHRSQTLFLEPSSGTLRGRASHESSSYVGWFERDQTPVLENN
jgi:hypothetical protein